MRAMSSAPILWLFGLPCSGKTTLAHALADALKAAGSTVCRLDGDEMRSGVNADLGFSESDRSENLRRSAHIAKLLAGQGHTIIASFVTPMEVHRQIVRGIIGAENRMVFVDCPQQVCVQRDVKGMYAKALKNQMQGMTGVQSGFEEPADVDLSLHTERESIDECVAKLMTLLGK
jgi:adenylyl-sulfate kinase